MSVAPEVKSGLTLALIAGICTALVAATWQLTAERIAANQQAWLEQSLAPALSGLFYDTGVTESVMTIPAPHGLPGKQDAIVYRVYAAGEPVAALFVVNARNGYAGPIRLLIGIDTEGTVSGVLVLDHRETPGLGDRIESGKSDWLLQFNGHSLTNPEPAGWAIKRDGGEFDQLTGASVTPRAVIKAIKTTLQYFDAHAEDIFAAPADPTSEAGQ